MVLTDDCPKAVVTRISFQYKIASQIWQAKYWSGAQRGLQAVKSLLLGLSSYPWHFGAQQIGQGGSQTCKTVYETVVVIGQPKELLNVLG